MGGTEIRQSAVHRWRREPVNMLRRLLSPTTVPGDVVGAGVKRLAAARLLSVAGSGAVSVATVYYIYTVTGSALWITAVFLATTGVQSVALPYAGLLADRYGVKSVMWASEIVSAPVSILIAVLIFYDVGEPWLIVALASGLAIAQAMLVPASSAAVPLLTDDLNRANGIIMGAASAGRVGGPVLAGLPFILGSTWGVFVVNAVAVLGSAFLVLTLPVNRIPGRRRRRFSESLGGAYATVRSDRALRLLLTSSATAYIATSFAMVAEAPLAEAFGVGGVGYAVMMVSWGLGLVAGSAVAGAVLTNAREPTALLVGRIVMGTGILVVPFCPVFELVPPVMFAGGVGSGVLLVSLSSQVQRLTLTETRGAVLGLFEAVGTGAFVVGVMLAGVSVTWMGVRPAYVVGGVGTLLAAVPLLFRLRLELRPKPEDAQDIG